MVALALGQRRDRLALGGVRPARTGLGGGLLLGVAMLVLSMARAEAAFFERELHQLRAATATIARRIGAEAVE